MDKKISELTALPGALVPGDLLEVVRGSENYKMDAGALNRAGNLLSLSIAAGAVTSEAMTVTEHSVVAANGGPLTFTIVNALALGFLPGESYVVELISTKENALVALQDDFIFIRFTVDGTNQDSRTVKPNPFSVQKVIMKVPTNLASGMELTVECYQNYNYFGYAVLSITKL